MSAVRLQDGASSCFDGIEYYYYCPGCDYVSVYSYGSYHESSRIDPEIIYASEYGSTCGGLVEIYRCPCGERAFIENFLGCDLGSNTEWFEDSENKYNHRITTYGCAVTDPQGHFQYTVEYWYGYDSQCRQTSCYVYTFGSNTDNPYIVYSVVSNRYNDHNYEQITVSSCIEEVDCFIVSKSYYEIVVRDAVTLTLQWTIPSPMQTVKL